MPTTAPTGETATNRVNVEALAAAAALGPQESARKHFEVPQMQSQIDLPLVAGLHSSLLEPSLSLNGMPAYRYAKRSILRDLDDAILLRCGDVLLLRC